MQTVQQTLGEQDVTVSEGHKSRVEPKEVTQSGSLTDGNGSQNNPNDRAEPEKVTKSGSLTDGNGSQNNPNDRAEPEEVTKSGSLTDGNDTIIITSHGVDH